MVAREGSALGAAPSAMRPISPSPIVSGVAPQLAAWVGRVPAAREEVQVAPESTLLQTSPTLPVLGPPLQAPAPPPACAGKNPGQAQTPLTAHTDWPAEVPR